MEENSIVSCVAAESKGSALIFEERLRQINKLGWTSTNDDQYKKSELALAAVCYATPKIIQTGEYTYINTKSYVSKLWPWKDYPYQSDRSTIDGEIADLVKAGALIAAEIDRLIRLK